MKLLEIKNLSHSFKERQVLNNISIELNQGEILCFLGPNGAGKSTTINILSGILKPDQGEIIYQGKVINKKTLKQFQHQLGIVPQDLALYEDLTAYQNVQFFASLYGLKKNELHEQCLKALEQVGLLKRKDDKTRTFSGGMKRRLNIACAIAHQPKLIIMDEPTVGIDPQSRNHILESIKELKKAGTTIIYSTHYMEEVEAIADRIIILDLGNIIATGTINSLKSMIESNQILDFEISYQNEIDLNALYHLEGINDLSLNHQHLSIQCLRSIDNLDAIITILMKQNVHINKLESQQVSLETVFLHLTGKSLRD